MDTGRFNSLLASSPCGPRRGSEGIFPGAPRGGWDIKGELPQVREHRPTSFAPPVILRLGIVASAPSVASTLCVGDIMRGY